MRNSSWRKWLTVAVASLGFPLGVAVASIVVATQSRDCAYMMDRTITLWPPGMRCYGPKDGVLRFPWGTGASHSELISIFVIGGGLGALLAGITCSRLTSRKSVSGAATGTQ